MTGKQLRALERRLVNERRRDRYLPVTVDGEARVYKLSPVGAGDRRWWCLNHSDLGPRYRHARWRCVRVNTPYRSEHYEMVNGGAVTYSNWGRTRGEVLRVLVRTLLKDGAKSVTVKGVTTTRGTI